MNSQPVLTQDFTTDQSGRILSMTYDITGEGYDGELYFHYDHFGNTTLLTDEEGDPVFSAQYNPCRGTTLQTWNTNNLEIINLGQGRSGTISLPLPANVTALVTSSRTITISEEVISAFVARYGTNLVCYVEDYGPQSSVNGNPDANPCSNESDCAKINQWGLENNLQYRDWMGEYDEACGFSGQEYGINGFDCNEQLLDYMFAKCMYEREDLSDDEKNEYAYMMRYYVCVSAKHNCTWGKHMRQFEGSMQGMLIAESARKCKNCSHANVTSPMVKEYSDECELIAKS